MTHLIFDLLIPSGSCGRGVVLMMEFERAQELHSRFTHLLQPIRDLTKNWDVDVASQLEEYLEEVLKGRVVLKLA